MSNEDQRNKVTPVKSGGEGVDLEGNKVTPVKSGGESVDLEGNKDTPVKSGGEGVDLEGNKDTPEVSEGSGGQDENGTVETNSGNRVDRIETKVYGVQQTFRDYLEFLEYIFSKKNFRFGVIMQTSVTLVLLVGWSILLEPAKDALYYQVLKYPRPPELDPFQISDFMKEHKQTSDCNLTGLQTNYKQLNKTYTSLQEYVKHLQENSTAFNKMLKEHDKQINKTSLSVENIGSNVTSFHDQLQHQSAQTHRVKQDMDRTVLKQISEEIWQYVCIILAVGEIGLVVYVLKLKSLLGDRGRQLQVLPPQSVDTPHSNGAGYGRPRSVLDGVSKKSTENSVCVLSFNGDPAHYKHVTVSRSFLDQKVKVTQFIIRKEEDILTVPPSKVVLVHVDFNSRNIILENPEREIGELRRTTVLALWRMGADVILLYHYEDKKGKPPGDQDLYSSDLVSVRTQTELKQLEGRQRFISLNGQLSVRQKQHLQELVKNRIG